MAAELLSDIVKRSQALDQDDKRRLARLLLDQANKASTPEEKRFEVNQRDAALHLAWLKANRDEYSEQYVALQGDKLVGHGKTRREAEEQANQQGYDHPFLVYVLSFDTIADGGL